MVHLIRSTRSNIPSISLHHQLLGVLAYNIPVFPISCSADFSAGSRSYLLWAVWMCNWKKGLSYVFSKWISKYIWPITCDEFYSGSYCPRNHASEGRIIPAPQLCYSILVGTSQPRSMLFDFIPQPIPPLSALLNSLYLDWRSSIPFCILSPPLHAPQPGIGAVHFPPALL